MPRTVLLRCLLVLGLLGPSALPIWAQAATTLAQARRALEASAVPARLAAVERLGEIGTMADGPRLMPRLSDRNETVRAAATTSLWQIWSRSGDAATDAMLARGLAQLRGARLEQALATFDEVVRRKPDFAEGWHRRATVRQLLGQHAAALRDAGEALQRNPLHFGALGIAGQSHLALGERERALEAFRRALKLNPNLVTVTDTVRELEQRPASNRRSAGS